MLTNLIKVEKLKNGNIQETFTSDNPKFGNVSFEYTGTNESLTNFLKTMIFNYARKNKMID